MLIYKRQFEQLSTHMMNSFIQQATVVLKMKFPAATSQMDTENLHKIIEISVTKAKAYGIVKRNDVMSYLELVMYFGIDFDKSPPSPAVTKILKTISFTGTEKIDRIGKMNLIKSV
jgi:hypothetical protein